MSDHHIEQPQGTRRTEERQWPRADRVKFVAVAVAYPIKYRVITCLFYRFNTRILPRSIDKTGSRRAQWLFVL